MKYKVIILDFDGVIVQSNNIKHQAFSEIFKNYPDHYETIMKYHFEHNHVPRQAKFKYFFEHVLKQPYSSQDINKMVLNFTELTRDKIINCPYVKGAVEFLDYFYKKIPLYVASATPHDELNVIIKARGLSSYFKEIYGAPVKKTEMFKDILINEKIYPNELLFTGDSIEDYNAALEMKINFIAIACDNNFKEIPIKKFKDLSGVEVFLREHMIFRKDI